MTTCETEQTAYGILGEPTQPRLRGMPRDGRRDERKRGKGAAAPGPGVPLARSAQRLLQALAAPGAAGQIDPIEEDRVLVRAGAGSRGVSLSAGAFPRRDADALVAEDLAAWQREGRGRRLVATDAGRARLRRAGDAAAPFAAQHRTPAVETLADPHDGRPTKLAVNAAESPLAWLAKRRNRDGTPFLDAAALQAGERLRGELTVAGIMPGVTVDWSRFGGGGAATGSGGERLSMTEALVSARQRLARVFEALGPEDTDLLVDVCGFLKGLETVERERGWPARSGKMLLARALGRLAAHWGLSAQARGRDGPARMVAWRG